MQVPCTAAPQPPHPPLQPVSHCWRRWQAAAQQAVPALLPLQVEVPAQIAMIVAAAGRTNRDQGEVAALMVRSLVERGAAKRAGCRSGLLHWVEAPRPPLRPQTHQLDRESSSCSAAAAHPQKVAEEPGARRRHCRAVDLLAACASRVPCPSCPQACRWTLRSCWRRCSPRWQSCVRSRTCGLRQMRGLQPQKRQQQQAQPCTWKLRCGRRQRHQCEWHRHRCRGPAAPRASIGSTASGTATAAASPSTTRARTRRERLIGATTLGGRDARDCQYVSCER